MDLENAKAIQETFKKLFCLYENRLGIRKRAANPQPYTENESLFPVFGRRRD